MILRILADGRRGKIAAPAASASTEEAADARPPNVRADVSGAGRPVAELDGAGLDSLIAARMVGPQGAVVISNGVLNLFPDKLAGLGEMARVLKPGGRLQIGDILVEKSVGDGAKRNIDLWKG
jgi:SAM-dependent methyltransferase